MRSKQPIASALLPCSRVLQKLWNVTITDASSAPSHALQILRRSCSSSARSMPSAQRVRRLRHLITAQEHHPARSNRHLLHPQKRRQVQSVIMVVIASAENALGQDGPTISRSTSAPAAGTALHTVAISSLPKLSFWFVGALAAPII